MPRGVDRPNASAPELGERAERDAGAGLGAEVVELDAGGVAQRVEDVGDLAVAARPRRGNASARPSVSKPNASPPIISIGQSSAREWWRSPLSDM